MALTARDVMTTEMITVSAATPLSEFARVCAEDNISGAPVTRVDGTLVGIVTKTDLIQRLLDDHPRHGSSEEFTLWDADVRQVGDIMQTEVRTVSPDTPLHEIARHMSQDRIHRVVVTESSKLVGIVTSIDLLAHFPKEVGTLAE
ncbi:MAG: CBS domain-containing protein [Planctomycetota bacterium]|jgi:CBS domain-containing protein